MIHRVPAPFLDPLQGTHPEKTLSCKRCFIYSGVSLNLSGISDHVRFAPCVAQVEHSAEKRNGLHARASFLMWADCAKSTIVLRFRWAHALRA